MDDLWKPITLICVRCWVILYKRPRHPRGMVVSVFLQGVGESALLGDIQVPGTLFPMTSVWCRWPRLAYNVVQEAVAPGLHHAGLICS